MHSIFLKRNACVYYIPKLYVIVYECMVCVGMKEEIKEAQKDMPVNSVYTSEKRIFIR